MSNDVLALHVLVAVGVVAAAVLVILVGLLWNNRKG